MDWAMKGVNLGRREIEQEPQPTAPNLAPMVNTAPIQDATPRTEAAAVLFNAGVPAAPYTPQQSSYAAPSYGYADPNAAAYTGYAGFGGALAGPTIGNRHILVSNPRTDAEVAQVVEHLRTNEAVIVNFEGIPTADTQRRIDFLSGVACGLGGTIKPLDSYKYILTPSGIGIR
jgi:hypothetical protein